MITPRMLCTALAAAGAIAAASNTYQIDPAHSSAQFTVRHMMVSNVRGQFSKVTGTIIYDPQDLAASSINASIDATTIDTREPKRDDHLKSADFFDVTKYPAITFTSKQFTRAGGKLQVRGDLAMHGITREVVLAVDDPSPEVKDPRGLMRTGTSAATVLNRKDWGLTWNRAVETGGVVVGDEIKITLDIEVTRDAGAPGAGPTIH